MKKTQFTKLLSFGFCIVLIAAMALMTTACNDNQKIDLGSFSVANTQSTSVGEGDTQFEFTVIDQNGAASQFIVSTDKKIVGEALIDVGLIKGEEGQYGLYVKTVNGITLDFDTDGKYWAFYVNGAYAMSGVDTTEIKTGDTYAFKAEK